MTTSTYGFPAHSHNIPKLSSSKKRYVMLKTKLLAFLKEAQPIVIVNQHVSTIYIEVERNKERQK